MIHSKVVTSKAVDMSLVVRSGNSYDKQSKLSKKRFSDEVLCPNKFDLAT